MERLFAAAILKSEVNGFEVFQVHAAHGYWLSQLLSRSVNRRTDRYAWPSLAVLDGIVGIVRRKRPSLVLDIRVSLIEGFRPCSEELAERAPLLQRIAESGFDIVSISAGHYGLDKRLIYPQMDAGGAVYVAMADGLARSRPSTIWNVSGNIWDLRAAPEGCAENLTFGIGRSLIADPRFVARTLKWKDGAVVPCTREGHCHYYSHGGRHLVCPQSPDLRVERERLKT
jgi:2,4-dienoyl-CoA reductase-like NADH-dependent reductase (Old Yellow Enzyme family)